MSFDAIQHDIEQCSVSEIDKVVARTVQNALMEKSALGLISILCTTVGEDEMEKLLDSLEAIRLTSAEK